MTSAKTTTVTTPKITSIITLQTTTIKESKLGTRIWLHLYHSGCKHLKKLELKRVSLSISAPPTTNILETTNARIDDPTTDINGNIHGRKIYPSRFKGFCHVCCNYVFI